MRHCYHGHCCCDICPQGPVGVADHKGTHQLPAEEETDGQGTQGASEEEHQGKHSPADSHRR